MSNLEFLRVATNARRERRGEEELDIFDFEELVNEKLKLVKIIQILKKGLNYLPVITGQYHCFLVITIFSGK